MADRPASRTGVGLSPDATHPPGCVDISTGGHVVFRSLQPNDAEHSTAGARTVSQSSGTVRNPETGREFGAAPSSWKMRQGVALSGGYGGRKNRARRAATRREHR